MSIFPTSYLTLFSIVWGAIWGSFATVVITRLPKEESIVFPGSHCPICSHPISWYENIPVLSYLILAGRCRHCKNRISPFYPLVELGSIILALIAINYAMNRANSQTLSLLFTNFMIFFTFFWALFVVSIIDIQTMLIPDIITLPGIVLFVTYNLLLFRESALWISLAVVCSYLGVFIFFNFLYKLLFGVEAMGMGDAKLLAMISALTGWKGAIFSLVAGSAQGIIISILIFTVKKWKFKEKTQGNNDTGSSGSDNRGAKKILRTKIPFGPMLSLGAFEFVLWGEKTIDWYLSLIDKLVLLIAKPLF